MGRIFTWLGGLAVATTLLGCAEHVMPDGNGSASSGLSDGTALSESEVASLLRQAGFPSNVIGKMVCTAKYESSLDPNATNHNSNGSTDYGLFQINSVHLGSTQGCPSSANALFDPLTNAQCAYGVYSLQGINAWVAYRSHRGECDGYQAEDDYAASTPTGPTGPTAPGGAGSYGASGNAGSADPYGDPYATGSDPYGQGPSYGGSDPYGNGSQGGGPSYGGNGYGGDPYGGQGGGYQNTGYGPSGYGTDGMSDFSGAEGDEDCDPYTGRGCGGSGGNVIIWYF